jgi:hypothetical protein
MHSIGNDVVTVHDWKNEVWWMLKLYEVVHSFTQKSRSLQMGPKSITSGILGGKKKRLWFFRLIWGQIKKSATLDIPGEKARDIVCFFCQNMTRTQNYDFGCSFLFFILFFCEKRTTIATNWTKSFEKNIKVSEKKISWNKLSYIRLPLLLLVLV